MGRLVRTMVEAAAAIGGAPVADALYAAKLAALSHGARRDARALRARHAGGIATLLNRVARSRGAVVQPPILRWGELRQRPQQLLSQLARRGFVGVFCSSDPRADGVDGIAEVEPNVFVCSDVRLTFALERPTVWVTSSATAVAAYLPFYRGARVVYDHLDDLAVSHLHCGAMERHHEALLRSADLVLATADRLAAHVRALRPDVLLVPNAVHPDDFAAARRGAVPDDLAPVLRSGRPVVGYHGALARWIDYALLDRTALDAPDLELVLVGPDHDGSARRLRARRNVHVLGAKPYAELPRYLRRFDVGMIPFTVDAITRAASPVKLFEYLAAGVPVVSTALDECRKYRSVTVAGSAPEFVAALRASVGRRDDPRHRALAAREASENTWRERVDRIVDRLERLARETCWSGRDAREDHTWPSTR